MINPENQKQISELSAFGTDLSGRSSGVKRIRSSLIL